MSLEIPQTHVGAKVGFRESESPVRNGLIAGIIVSFLILFCVWILASVIPDKTGSPIASIREFCEWLSSTRIGLGLRESLLMFPIVEGIHLIGISVSVGVLVWFDLRLMGLVFRDQPVSKVWKQMMPVAGIGFVVVFLTGGLLFSAEAVTAYDSMHFWIKIGLILLAGINAAYFEFKLHPGIAAWDHDPLPPRAAHITGLVSLVLWTAIIITGRTMAYSF